MSYFHTKDVMRGEEPIKNYLKELYPSASDQDINNFISALKENNPYLFSEDGRQVITEKGLAIMFIDYL